MKPSLREKIERLSLTKLEILCNANFQGDEGGNAEALEEQKEIVAYLAHLYKFGGKRAAPDPLKAAKFEDLLNRLNGNPSAPSPSMIKDGNSFYTASGWFNFTRLYALRVLMVLEYFLKKTLIPRLYGIGGILYVLDATFDIFDITREVVRPAQTEEEMKMGFWELRAQRFKNALTVEGRLPHLMNAIVWGPINTLTFIFTGAWTVALTLAGFGWDGVTEIFKGGKDYHDHSSLLDEYSKELKEKRAELDTLQKQNNSNLGEPEQLEKIKELQKEVKKLESYERELTKELSTTKMLRSYSVFSCFVVLAGITMMMIPIPPVQAVGVGLTIAGLALNLGEKLWEAYKFFTPSNVPAPAKAVNKEPNVVEEENTHDVTVDNTYANQLGVLFSPDNSAERRPLLRNATDQLVPVTSSADNLNLNIAKESKLEVVPKTEVFANDVSGETLQTQSIFARTSAPIPIPQGKNKNGEPYIGISHSPSDVISTLTPTPTRARKNNHGESNEVSYSPFFAFDLLSATPTSIPQDKKENGEPNVEISRSPIAVNS